jgi:hypothetical protein
MTQTQETGRMNKIKVSVPVEKVQLDAHLTWPPYESESLWAEARGDEKAVLLNSPFFARGLSYLDEIEFTKEHADGTAELVGIVAHSGHGTVRAILTDSNMLDEATAAINKLERLGCTWEGGDGSVVAIDIPPGVRKEEVMAILDEAKAKAVFYVDVGFLP